MAGGLQWEAGMRVDLIKVNGGLFPSLEPDRLMIEKVKRGVILSYDLKKLRNAGYHRRYFALLTVISNNTRYSVKQLLHLIKLKIGHFETVISTTGKVTYMTKSISFAKMDQDVFEIFYSKTIDIALRDFIVNTTRRDIQIQVDMILRFD